MLAASLVAFGTTLILQPLVIVALRRRQVLDRPTERSSHTVPTPRGGGLAVAVGVLVAAAVTGTGGIMVALGVTCAAAAAIGLVEDVHGVSPRVRLVAVIAAAVPVAVQADGPHAALIASAALLYVVSVVNAVNFMDGINGISAAQGAVGGAAFAAFATAVDAPQIGAFAAAVAGASLAFAPFNVPRAQVFLGDCGSYVLGAALASCSYLLWARGLPVEAAVAPLALYLADTGTTLLRRVRAGEAWHQPHRTHVYQRLTDLGWTHTQVSGLVLALIAACSLAGAASLHGVAARIIGDLLLVVLLLAYLQLPRVLRTRAPAT